MLTDKQKRKYARIRRTGKTASEALQRARDFETGAEYGSSAIWSHNSHFPRGAYPESECSNSVRWIENTAQAGLRFVGFADEITSSIEHTGWYTDEFGDNGETYRGAVWQLPGRAGRAQYVAGYPDPCNEGAARIDFDIIEGNGTDYYSDWKEDARDAARAADEIARIDAEREREYQEGWQAGNKYRECNEAITDIRRRTLELIREAKTECARLRETAPAIVATIADTIRKNRAEIKRLRRERDGIDQWSVQPYADGFAEGLR